MGWSLCRGKQRQGDRLVICFQLITEAWLLLHPMLPSFLGGNTSPILPQQGLLGFLPFARPKAKVPCMELSLTVPALQQAGATGSSGPQFSQKQWLTN